MITHLYCCCCCCSSQGEPPSSNAWNAMVPDAVPEQPRSVPMTQEDERHMREDLGRWVVRSTRDCSEPAAAVVAAIPAAAIWCGYDIHWMTIADHYSRNWIMVNIGVQSNWHLNKKATTEVSAVLVVGHRWQSSMKSLHTMQECCKASSLTSSYLPNRGCDVHAHQAYLSCC